MDRLAFLVSGCIWFSADFGKQWGTGPSPFSYPSGSDFIHCHGDKTIPRKFSARRRGQQGELTEEMETIKEVWSGILQYLHDLDDISEIAYNVWITCIEPVTIENGEVVVQVHSDFQKNIIQETYADKLKNAFEAVLGIPLGLKILSRE